MKQLLSDLEKLKQSSIKQIVDKRIREFESFQNSSNKEIFKELCFCILTANYQAKKSIAIQKEIDNGFLTLTQPNLSKKLRGLGYRFPNVRAKYIVEARKHVNTIKQTLSSFKDENKLREWVVKNVKGLGFKESSHFLRNIGYKNFAIIDFHIVDILVKHGLTKRPKTLTKKHYLETEKVLEQISKRSNLTQAELDLYLWYQETGKILK